MDMDNIISTIKIIVAIIISSIIFLLALTYVKSGMWRGEGVPEDARFQVVYTQSDGIDIVEDTETGVKYLYKAGLGSFTVLEDGEDINVSQESIEE